MKDLVKWVTFGGIFAMPFIVLIISNSMFFPFITGKNFTFRIIVEIIFAAWIIWMLYEPSVRPKRSWILISITSLIVVMFFANLWGEYPLKSFWSNFERMEGYVTLVHFFLYFLVVGSVLQTDKLWNRFFNTALLAGTLLAFYAFAQLSGNITINQGGVRLDGTLGNSTYMAVYTLFHIFIAAFLFTRTQSRNWQYVYAAFIALFVYLLFQTATRGTTLGLIGGSFIGLGYVTLFGKQYPRIRKTALTGLLVVVVAVGAFIAAKDTSVIKENRILNRLASISLEAGETRFTIWGMALEGVKERPLLGWGQGNFNYVFNGQYHPSLHSQEQWFDRVHNIVMDWLIAGGILGAVAYFSIFFAAIYYLFVQPLLRKGDSSFTVVERAVLLGLLVGYMIHNIFVFDNIVSYIFYAIILALIHAKVSTEVPVFTKPRVSNRVIEQVAAPVVLVLVLGTIYVVNVPNILAAKDIIDAFTSTTADNMIAEFDEALSRGSFGDQEIIEQMTRQTQNIIRAEGVPAEFKQEVFKKTEEELLKLAEEKPGDARIHVFISSYYRFTNNLVPAREQLARARELSPNKQQIIFEQGLVELQQQDFEAGLVFFKEAFELEPEFLQARTFYAAAALFAGESALAYELLSEDETYLANFAGNDFALQAAYTARETELLKDIFEKRIEQNPNDSQLRVSLAVTYQESGDTETAIQILEQAGEDIPSFKAQSESFIADLRAGRTPGQPSVSIEGEEVESHSMSN